MTTLVDDEYRQLIEQNDQLKISYETTYLNMISILNSISIRIREARDSAMLVERAASRQPINTVDMERLGVFVEEQAAIGERQLAELDSLHTNALVTIAEGSQLAYLLDDEDLQVVQDYWTPRWTNLNRILFRIENARSAVHELRELATQTRRIISDPANARGRVVLNEHYENTDYENTDYVNELMTSTKKELAIFDKLYEDYIEACIILGKTPDTIPEEYICPLSHQIMIKPVFVDKFRNYEKAYIFTWLLKNETDPANRNTIYAYMFEPNTLLENEITAFRDRLTQTIKDSKLPVNGGKLKKQKQVKQTKRRRRQVKQSKRYKNKYSKRHH